MNLNLGCGFDRREGWLNVDRFEPCEPDLVMDIEATPWPFETGAFSHVLMKHVLEHVGANFPTFGSVIQELHRVLEPGGQLEIHVPHLRHDNFWSDPTHVRAFTPLSFAMLSKRQNQQWMESRANFTMLAVMLDVDFEIVGLRQFYTAEWQDRLDRGEVTPAQAAALANERWNVAQELHATLRAVK